MAGFRTGAPVALLLAATAILSFAAAPVAAQQTCSSAADVGRFLGWCRCSSLTAPRDAIAFNGASPDPWCKVTTPDTRIYYCDPAGKGNCDLQCVKAVHECTGAVAPNGVCSCAVGNVRTVLQYNGPL
eukprot:TRINITY_DN1037_c0_g1_i4.p2 TRINITY_DN1037_c0_g1~~TRINITY_DN1037_c0_g1_i4.p2  ORF type:complete len:128 (-),score=45.93 TRINITY_DN1037_c0_g1_i4:199-582(-)